MIAVRDPSYLLAHPTAGYRGSDAARWFLTGLAVLMTVRSLAHILLPDGGANLIAGIELSGPAGDNLVHLFAQWGLEQLLLAGLTWVVLLRYRFLIPFALLLQLIDWSMRFAIGEWKPLIVDSPPPGAWGNLILAPLCAVFLWLSLPKRNARDP